MPVTGHPPLLPNGPLTRPVRFPADTGARHIRKRSL